MPSVSTSPTGCQYPDPIPGIIPFRSVTLFSGPSGAGKTTMYAEMLARVWTGRTICGKPTNKPTGLYYLAGDRQWDDDYQPWFDLLGLPDIPHYAIADDELITKNLWQPENAIEFFDHCLAKLQPIPGSILAVDPMTPLFIVGHPGDQRAVMRSLIAFAHRCRHLQITIWAAAWHGKQKTENRDRYRRAIDRIAGSTAFAGCSHTQLYIEEPEEGCKYQVFGWRPRHAKEETFKFVRDEVTGLFRPYHETPDPALDRLLALFPEDGLYVERDTLLAQLSTIPMAESTFYKALKILERTSKVQKVRRGVYQKLSVH